MLGLHWTRHLDNLKVNISWTKNVDLEKITKHSILTVAHKVFDPICFTSPVNICLKMMLQKTWTRGIKCDYVVTSDLKEEFIEWFRK